MAQSPEPTGCFCFARRGRKTPASKTDAAHDGSSSVGVAARAPPPHAPTAAPSRSAEPLAAVAARAAATADGTAARAPPALEAGTPDPGASRVPAAAGTAGREAAPSSGPLPAAAAASALDSPEHGPEPEPEPEPELERDARAASASSLASTAFFSVAGWSQFGEEDDWAASPAASRAHSTTGAAGSAQRFPPGAAPSAQTSGQGAGEPGPSAGDAGEARAPVAAGARGRDGGEQQQEQPPHHHPHQQPLQGPEAGASQPRLPALREEPSEPAAAAGAGAGAAAAAQGAAPAGDAAAPDAVLALAESDPDGAAGAASPAGGLPPPPHPPRPGGAAAAAEHEAMLDRVAELYGVHGRPCKACQVLLSYCRTKAIAPGSLKEELRARELPDASSLATVVQGVSDGLADIASDEGWQVMRNDELRLLYKHLPGQGVHAFRARCELDAPTEHLVALAREVDLAPTWNKYCSTAEVLRQMSPTDVTVYMSLWVPWPLNDVGFCVEAAGSDLLDEEGCLLITFSSPGRAEGGVQLPAAASKHGRVRLLRPSAMSFVPLPPRVAGGPQRTLCCVQAYVDPGTRHVPPFIISFVLKVLSPFMFSAVKKVLASAFKSPDNPLPSRIKERYDQLYGLVRLRSEAFLQAKRAAPAAAVGTGNGPAAAGSGGGGSGAAGGRK